ncbi:MAG: thioredoxin domain-containing protein [Planctomycetaceae bacterium]
MHSSQNTNRLAGETSPYLLQHARNPVDWHPWDDVSLNLAKELDRPIFLSIGYSACHWCHVMEHESFENPEIAAVMNAGFVNIKVDREERPDLDQIYMNAVTAMTGHGGWPMSVFLTPDLQPFFGGTYWPPETRWGRPGFREVLAAVQDAWQNRRDAVSHQAEELTQAVIHASQPVSGESTLEENLLRNALRSLLRNADRVHGGFGSAPKFPHPMDLRVLLRCARRFGDEEAIEIVRLTLDKMAAGGIYDQLGGGFARYSTDERWLAPHFEKMLYDNALLVPVYLEAYQITKHRDDLRVVRETLDYVLREMTQPQGGFYSTQDADSEGEEGKFFVWSEAEILAVLGPDDGKVFCVCYDVTPGGNWEHQNILNRPKTTQSVASLLNRSAADLETLLAKCRRRLFEIRSQRIPPGRDEKILAGWNGLMIAAMAQAGAVLQEPKYLEAAKSAAEFVLSQMMRPTTSSPGKDHADRLWHCWKDGRARFPAYLDDYACLIDGLVELAQATFDAAYLDQAGRLAQSMIEQFADPEAGGFFYTADDHEALIARNKEIHDNATPSGNGMAATALLKLGRLTGRRDWEAKAVETLQMMSGTLARLPSAAGQALIALDFLIGPNYELMLVAGQDVATADRTVEFVQERFLPNKVFWRQNSEETVPQALEPLLAGKSAIDGQTSWYVCQEGACQTPVSGWEAIQAAIPD